MHQPSLRTAGVALTLTLALAACSDSTGPCANSEGLGIPAFDLIGSLRVRGAEVEDLGQRLDMTVFSVPTRVLSVNGEEVLTWAYCIGGGEDKARDLGQFGVGVFAQDPPPLTLGPDEHMWSFAEHIAQYVGTDSGIVELFNEVMGPELLTR
jgi:hypothetical protein